MFDSEMDFAKAYDKVDWVFLGLVLPQIGILVDVSIWILACVSLANFEALFNGALTKFFNSSRGLQKGCPSSPLLFLLVIEGLSRMISEAKMKGKFSCLKISSALKITHLLFVDDVIIFWSDKIEDWKVIYHIITIFCLVSAM